MISVLGFLRRNQAEGEDKGKRKLHGKRHPHIQELKIKT
jgi:hypothetical protein